ncbi:MAG: hypothetical protein L3J06_03665 [Cyclobacteriaceae bacterium]|nr:hypothetical protein [Cyclobacteriaceae bacterium]
MPQQKKADSLLKMVEITNKDVGISLSTSAILTEDDLLKELTRAIKYLIDKDFEKLMQILYRVDVSETKVKHAFGLEQDVAEQIARLIIAREQQKVITRARYSNS